MIFEEVGDHSSSQQEDSESDTSNGVIETVNSSNQSEDISS